MVAVASMIDRMAKDTSSSISVMPTAFRFIVWPFPGFGLSGLRHQCCFVCRGQSNLAQDRPAGEAALLRLLQRRLYRPIRHIGRGIPTTTQGKRWSRPMRSRATRRLRMLPIWPLAFSSTLWPADLAGPMPVCDCLFSCVIPDQVAGVYLLRPLAGGFVKRFSQDAGDVGLGAGLLALGRGARPAGAGRKQHRGEKADDGKNRDGGQQAPCPRFGLHANQDTANSLSCQGEFVLGRAKGSHLEANAGRKGRTEHLVNCYEQPFY